MNDITALVEMLGNYTSAEISSGDIKGVITKLAEKEQGSISVSVTTKNEVKILDENYDSETKYSKLVRIPKEASRMAVKRNGSFAAVVVFPGVRQSPVRQNISASDFRALTYITSVGCGMSLFFLAVALFMHCLIRKGKASDATKILINLFVAMFTLNLSFLVNESVANLRIFGACVAMAATMHYTMLATFTWFFMEAIHLYFNLWKLPAEIKHYLTKVYVAGWGTPAVVVTGLLASQNYGYVVIQTDNGSSSKMCWIPDAAVHQGVNIGYYAIVFLFTFAVFITTVRQIVTIKPKEEKAQNVSSIKANSLSIIGLVLLLGITWAFAFFSYGPLLVPSYYIFTILNSFQGFFLFIYYYNSRKRATGDSNAAGSSGSTATSNTVRTSPYQ
ncbi:adhesion G-protein coupled receptor G2-like isoform X3 [Acanthopagrus latus]|uniref:adhesion G-protein coupled receptor G2-like isoform X3 n=1 Tax=Acanthopagrus latus TaxID=8177 RepID=UPI00187CCB28|nr:adhesion G-protein coupled receptor G2-like isoform X3 [Acanthopagrus latus]